MSEMDGSPCVHDWGVKLASIDSPHKLNTWHTCTHAGCPCPRWEPSERRASGSARRCPLPGGSLERAAISTRCAPDVEFAVVLRCQASFYLQFEHRCCGRGRRLGPGAHAVLRMLCTCCLSVLLRIRVMGEQDRLRVWPPCALAWRLSVWLAPVPLQQQMLCRAVQAAAGCRRAAAGHRLC